MTGAVTRAEATGGELARMLATLAWIVGASAVTLAFLGAQFDGAPRHARRVDKIRQIEEQHLRRGDGIP